MSDATLIEAHGRTAGLLVRISAGRFRFFSSMRAADRLDGRTFRSVAQAVRAVETLRCASVAF